MPKTVAELEAELAAHEATRAATATERDQARQAHQAAEQAAQRHQAAVARVTQALAEAGVAVPADGDPAEGVRTVVSELQAARPLAETGRTYRNDLIAETLKQGVRAFGAPFSQDTMRAVLERSTLDEIKHMRTVWTEQADKVFGTGGRQTVEDQARNDGTRTSTVPSYLYRA